MAFSNLFSWVKQQTSQTVVQRQLLVIGVDNGLALATAIAQLYPEKMSCWLGDMPPSARVSVQRPTTLFKQVLGQEFDLAVYNARDGFRPSALLALAGTVRQGGLCIILTPSLLTWPYHFTVTAPHHLSYGFSLSESRYIRQLSQAILSDDTIAVVDEHCERFPVTSEQVQSPASVFSALTLEQQQVLTGIEQDINAGVSLVALTALRGRGKSTVLGTLAGHLAQQGISVALTSPVHQTQQVFFAALAEAVGHNTALLAKVCWLAPDSPQLVSGQWDVLLVDEAAALPQPVLTRYMETNNQVVVSSTTAGFEGSGLGFIYKFLQPRLHSGQASHYQLHTAMRWHHEDHMERWLHRVLFIDTMEKLPDSDKYRASRAVTADTSQLQVRCWRPDAIPPNLLQSLFSLLRSAHYQTTPEDFMRMMDAPDGLFFVAHTEDTVVGAAVVTEEGGEKLADIAPDIACGKRRVKGHLSAQSAATLIVDASLAAYRYWRIGRIATLSFWRRKGVGSKLLSAIEDYARQDEADWLATSYGHTRRLEQFWQHNQFSPVRLGQKADKASGLVSLLMLRPLSGRASQRLNDLSDAYQLDQGDDTIHSSLTISIITRRLQAFCHQTMALEQIGNALPCFIAIVSQSGEKIPPILQARYVDMLTNQQLFSQFSLSGKKALNEAIRTATVELMQAY